MDPQASQPSSRPLLLACAIAVAFGVYLRVQQLGFPPTLSFDEHHFVENARNYLAGKPDWNDHPPLGKLLMAVSMSLIGDSPTGWRMTALGCGLASIVLAYLAGRVLFRDALAGALAAAFFAIDGFLLAYSRTALLDGMLVTFSLCALLLLAPGPSRARLIGAGLIAGLASSIKLSGVTIALPIALAVAVWRERRPAKLLVVAASGLVALLVYYVEYAIGQRLTGLPASPAGVASATLAMLKHHAALTQMTHPLTSHWYTWFLPLRPITLRFDVVEDGLVRTMTTLGNPLLWWSTALVVLWTLVGLLKSATTTLYGLTKARNAAARGTDELPGSIDLRNLPATGAWAPLLLVAFFLGFLSPWVLTGRDSYIYHYLPCYSFGLILLAGAVARLFRRAPRATLSAVLLVALVSVFYAPVWAQLPLSEDAYAWRLFVAAWR
jgi:dolichyl-phosphate-mannose-protein mannosyltransferase